MRRMWWLACVAMLAAGAARAQQAGFERETMADGTPVGVWFPAAGAATPETFGLTEAAVVDRAVPGGRHALVVISHGTGGSYTGHADTAVALAKAGFVVAALTHPGDNWRDQSRQTDVEDRPRALRAMVSYMLDTWPERAVIDPARVGAFGFSAGGFTVLAAAGGRPDLSRMRGHCAGGARFYDCGVLRAHPRPVVGAWPDVADPRIRAIVVAAPALGFSFGRDGLKDVKVPVQLWRADGDMVLPAPLYADAVRADLPVAPEFQTVAGAGHFDFLAPCVPADAAPVICASAPGFDRVAFHARFNAAVVAFFTRTLASGGTR